MPDGSSLPEIKISQLPVGTSANLTDLLEASQQSVSGYVTASISVGQVATAVAGTLPAPPTIPTTLPPSGPAGGALNGTYPNPGLVGGPLSNYALTSSIPTTLPPSGAAGGGLSGSYPNPLIRPSATNGQVLTTVAGASAWAALPAAPTTLPPNGPAGGMLNGTYPNPSLAPSATNGWVMTTVAGVSTWAAPSGGASISVGDAPPGSPGANALWWNSTLGVLFLYYNDGNSTQWVPAAPAAASGVLQTVTFETGAMATGTTLIPGDDTIPQITEGDQYMTLAITPRSATSRLIIEVTAHLTTSSAAGGTMAAALFQDSTANALACGFVTAPLIATGTLISFKHIMTSGTTSATTFRVRGGFAAAGTTTFNGYGGGRLFGGTLASSIVITEVSS